MPLSHARTEVETTDRQRVEQLIRRIADECPQRKPTSRDEHRAQVILRAQLRRLHGVATWHRFRFNRNLYVVLALHFGLATLAACLFFVSPLWAAALHLLIAVSYTADSNRYGYWLRSLLPKGTASNLVVTFAARSALRRRVVVTAHADAAPTGWIFQQWFSGLGSVEKAPKILRTLARPLLIAVVGLVAVAAIEIHAWSTAKSLPQFPLAFYGFSFYFVVLTVLNLQIIWKNKTVAGANDNLSGCAALTVLAQRLTLDQPDDVEYVFVVTACEEAGTGGAWALARELRGTWEADKTDIVVLDSIGGGELCLFQEGEMIPWRIPAHLLQAARSAAADDERFAKLFLFPLPAGATDALPFLAQNFAALGVGRIDRRIGTPLHYHLPSDTPDTLNYEQVVETIDYVELLAHRLVSASSAHVT